MKIYRGWWIATTGYFSQLATTGATGWVFGVLVLPTQEALGWSRSEVVGVLTLSSLVGGALAFGLGPFVDKHGARGLMTFSALFGGVCLMALSLVQTPWQYYLCWAGFGLATPGLLNLGPAVAISNWFIKKRAQALMLYTLGSATAGLVLAPIMTAVADTASWRIAWLIMGIFVCSIAPMAWVSVRQRPEDVGLAPDGADPAAISLQAHEATAESESESAWTVHSALRSRPFWLLTIAFMLTSLPASSIFIHMSSYVQSKGFSSADAAGAVSIYGAGVLAGRFVWGAIVTRAGLHRSLVAYGIIYGLSIFLFLLPTSLPAIYAMTVLLGVSIAGAQQLQVQSFPDYFGRKIVGALLGYAGIASTLTRAAAPLIAAAAYDRTQSYTVSFSLFGVACLVASVAFLFSKPKSQPAQLESIHGAAA